MLLNILTFCLKKGRLQGWNFSNFLLSYFGTSDRQAVNTLHRAEARLGGLLDRARPFYYVDNKMWIFRAENLKKGEKIVHIPWKSFCHLPSSLSTTTYALFLHWRPPPHFPACPQEIGIMSYCSKKGLHLKKIFSLCTLKVSRKTERQ